MSLLSKLFGRSAKTPEAVLVHLDGSGLADEIYATCDLATLEDQLIKVIEEQRLGEFDGNEVGEAETTLYMYGPDAEKLYSQIQNVLGAYPLCQNARVVIRKGGPGAPQRELRIAGA